MQDYRTAFCINCGANEDVRDIMQSLGPTAQQFVRLVFIDSHRPIHHSLHNEDDHSCVLLHDPDCGDSPLESIPSGAASLQPGSGVQSDVPNDTRFCVRMTLLNLENALDVLPCLFLTLSR